MIRSKDEVRRYIILSIVRNGAVTLRQLYFEAPKAYKFVMETVKII